MATEAIPPGVIDQIVSVLSPEQIWLFGSRARGTHGPDSDWDLMAVLPDSAPDEDADFITVFSKFRELRRMRVEVIPMRRGEFDTWKTTHGELANSVVREGRVVYERCPRGQPSPAGRREDDRCSSPAPRARQYERPRPRDAARRTNRRTTTTITVRRSMA